MIKKQHKQESSHIKWTRKGRNFCGIYTYFFGLFQLIYEKKTLHLFLFAFWCLLTRNVDVLVFVSTLNPFRRCSRFSFIIKPLVPFIFRVFIMAGKYCFSLFCLKLFWIYMDIKNDYFCCNNFNDNNTFNISNYITACPHFS
jgi:hypothetical protein